MANGILLHLRIKIILRTIYFYNDIVISISQSRFLTNLTFRVQSRVSSASSDNNANELNRFGFTRTENINFNKIIIPMYNNVIL